MRLQALGLTVLARPAVSRATDMKWVKSPMASNS
jgi:hypothetical protein